MNSRRILQGAALALGTFLFSVGLQVYAQTWTAPTGPPPTSNADAPINTGSTVQTKAGGLNVTGNVGIGTTDTTTGGFNNKMVVKQSANALWRGFAVEGTDDTVLSMDYLGSNVFGLYTSYRGAGGYSHISFGPGGTEKMIITSGGNVGIGTSNPTAKLDAVGNIVNTASTYGWLGLTGDLPGYPTNTYPTLKTSGTYIYFSAGGGYSGWLMNDGITFRKFIDFDNNGYYLDPAATSRINYGVFDNVYSYSWIQSATAMYSPIYYDLNNTGYYVDPNGNSNMNTITANLFTYSDERLKKDIQPMTSALDKVRQLTGVSFKWKETNIDSIGFIAQDVEKVFPEIVSTDKTTGLKSVQYGNITAPLVESVKELDAEVQALRSQNIDLQKKVEEMQKALAKLQVK